MTRTRLSASDRQTRDASLLDRIRQGDERALEQLALAYTSQLRAIVTALLGAADLVDEVIQDVFISLWENRAYIDVRTNVAGYLYRSVRNRTISAVRHEQVEQRAAESFADNEYPQVTWNIAEQRLDAADLKMQLYAALEHVSPAPRQVFLLSWEGELTYSEIATLLGITVKSVRQQMYRATQALALHFPRRLEP